MCISISIHLKETTKFEQTFYQQHVPHCGDHGGRWVPSRSETWIPSGAKSSIYLWPLMRTRFGIRDKHQRMGGVGKHQLIPSKLGWFSDYRCFDHRFFWVAFFVWQLGWVVDSPFVPWPSDMQTRRRTPELNQGKEDERCWKVYMGGNPKIGETPKWMVKIMENPIKVDDLGVPLFPETSIWRVVTL